MIRRVSVLLCTCLLMAGVIAGCGGGDDCDTNDSNGAASNGAASNGDKPEVPPKTIGLLSQTSQSPANAAMAMVVEELGSALGWEVKTIDAQGNPQQISRGATTFLNEGVDAMIGITIDAPQVRTQLTQFQDRDIPTCVIGGGQPPTDLFSLVFTEDERTQGVQVGEYLAEQVPDTKVIVLKNTSVFAGTERYEGFREALLEGSDQAEIVAETEIDLTDPVGSTTRAVQNGLAAHPDADAIWSIFDLFNQPAVTAVKRTGSDAKVYAYFTSESATKELRDPESPMVALGDAGLSKSGALCLDQFLNHFVNDEPVNPDAMEEDPLVYQVISEDNVDEFVEPGEFFAFPPEREIEDFLERWQQEYTLP